MQEGFATENRKFEIGFCKMRFFPKGGVFLRMFEWLAQFESVFSTFGDQVHFEEIRFHLVYHDRSQKREGM